jgi:hypothetical protein
MMIFYGSLVSTAIVIHRYMKIGSDYT